MASINSDMLVIETELGPINTYGCYYRNFHEKQMDIFIRDYYKSRLEQLCREDKECSAEFRSILNKYKVSEQTCSKNEQTND